MRLAIAAAALFAAAPALAAATDWQELAPDTRIRLIASERVEAGTTHLALELDLPSGTKTYWRVPGETGIPLELDFRGSTGIGGHRVLWPFPEIEVKDGYTDFVLYGPTVIPIELAVTGDAANVEVSVLLGVCSDICVPATASFSLPIDLARPDAGQAIRIDQALASASIDWVGDGSPVGEVAVSGKDGEALAVSVDPARLDAEDMIVDASGHGYVFGAPKKSREPTVVAFEALGAGDLASLEGKTVQVVFMTRDGPFEVSRIVGPRARD